MTAPYASRFRKAAETCEREASKPGTDAWLARWWKKKARAFRRAAETSAFRAAQLPLFPKEAA